MPTQLLWAFQDGVQGIWLLLSELLSLEVPLPVAVRSTKRPYKASCGAW